MRGMVFGMLVRAGWGGSKSAQNARLWALWDAFGLEHAQMQGWWEPRPTAATGSAAVVATAYVRRGLTLTLTLTPTPTPTLTLTPTPTLALTLTRWPRCSVSMSTC